LGVQAFISKERAARDNFDHQRYRGLISPRLGCHEAECIRSCARVSNLAIGGHKALQAIIDELHETTRASRTTLRIARPPEYFPVVAETLNEGMRSIAADVHIDLRRAATVEFLKREQRMLVQRDCLVDEPAAPRELVDVYGTRAQMMAPIVRGGSLIGYISVHHAGEPRDWSEEDVAALESAAARMARELTANDDATWPYNC
jgi:maleate isomerase